MQKKIPVYDICNLTKDQYNQNDFLAEGFADYLKKHYKHLHFPHRHSFFHVVLFTKGKGTHTIDFSRFNVKPYQIYFMVPGQVHSWHFEDGMDGYIINFSETFFRSFLLNNNYLERFPFFNGIAQDSVCLLPANVQDKIVNFFREILIQENSNTAISMDMKRTLLIQLFLTVENSFVNTGKKIIPEQKQLLLKNFRRLIEQYYRTIKLPKDYADLLYVTPNHLNALCQDLLDKTAGELIRDRILLEAKRLLTSVEISITEIAYQLNFKDNSYFSRFFKKYEGVTPENFRNSFLDNDVKI